MLMGLLAAPAIIRTPGLLMPIKQQPILQLQPYQREIVEALEALQPGVYNATILSVESDGKILRMVYNIGGQLIGGSVIHAK